MKGNNSSGKRSDEATVEHHGVAQEIDWEDFRDHLATADKDGSRRWLYPKKPSGRLHRYRLAFAWLLIVVMFAGPFIKIRGNPLLMMNIIDRKFSILGQIFWPQDTIIFAVAMLVFFTCIIIFTTAFGRLWCGWACPQTVMMEMVFRKIEYLIEGDGPVAKARDAGPWTMAKVWRKALKHSVFLGLSFVIGNTLLSYIIGSDALLEIIRDDPKNHLTGLGFMVLFTLIFYGIFARFREQACTFICPYGRFQSALLDENTVVVAYDNKRGESRGPWKREQSHEERKASGVGDCVGCRQCVVVCPTGIDIRNGVQMECVNCTACIDACDATMDKVGLPRGLVRFASLNGIATGAPLRITPRMMGYAGLLVALGCLLAFLVFTRADVETTLLRAPGSMFQEAAGGRLSNLYTVRVVNKTLNDIPIEFRLENGLEGRIQVLGGLDFVVPKEKLGQRSLLVELDRSSLRPRSTLIEIGIYSKGRRIETVKTSFVGPGTLSGPVP
jgi:cytochrome c oxidase accessory protein FixG